MLVSSRRYAAMQRQTAVTAFLKSEQLLLFAFSGYFMCRQSSRQTTRCVKGSCHRGARSLLTLSASKLHYYHVSCPANTGHSPNAVSMLGQRRRRWTNIETALGECPCLMWYARRVDILVVQSLCIQAMNRGLHSQCGFVIQRVEPLWQSS